MIRTISSVLARVPSLIYAVVYLLVIPIFAGIFWLLPQNFYHSTVQYEASLQIDAERILRRLAKEIVETFKNHHGALGAERDGWQIDITAIHLYDFEPLKDANRFKMSLRFNGTKGEQKGVEQGMTLIIKLQNDKYYSTQNPKTGEWNYYRTPTIENIHVLPVSPKLIFPYRAVWDGDPVGEAQRPILLPISDVLETEMKSFNRTSKGFPSKSSGTYARMFYFSAVTITTLGYGDIVPITNLARLLVAIESILGIVLIGLFLNSLARENSR